MKGKDIRITSRDGGEFDCYLALPGAKSRVPAIVIASAVQGVDQDVRAIADEFAGHGYIAAAPDLFWRTIPGPLAHGDERTRTRSQPRLERIRAGEADMADTLAVVHREPQSNGRAAVIGLCYGGPYAIIGPKRLGYDAGISCHGSQMQDYVTHLEGVSQPVCIIWGDQDHAAPAAVLDAYRAVPPRMKNVTLHILPGVQHAYMIPGDVKRFDRKAREFSMARTLEILGGLTGEGGREPLRRAG